MHHKGFFKEMCYNKKKMINLWSIVILISFIILLVISLMFSYSINSTKSIQLDTAFFSTIENFTPKNKLLSLNHTITNNQIIKNKKLEKQILKDTALIDSNELISNNVISNCNFYFSEDKESVCFFIKAEKDDDNYKKIKENAIFYTIEKFKLENNKIKIFEENSIHLFGFYFDINKPNDYNNNFVKMFSELYTIYTNT